MVVSEVTWDGNEVVCLIVRRESIVRVYTSASMNESAMYMSDNGFVVM
jgi:hypothetical protein